MLPNCQHQLYQVGKKKNLKQHKHMFLLIYIGYVANLKIKIFFEIHFARIIIFYIVNQGSGKHSQSKSNGVQCFVKQLEIDVGLMLFSTHTLPRYFTPFFTPPSTRVFQNGSSLLRWLYMTRLR